VFADSPGDLFVDLAPCPRSYFRNRFTAGSGYESTERSVALARVWMALSLLDLVGLDRLVADLSQKPSRELFVQFHSL
jgi:hypothetical protein